MSARSECSILSPVVVSIHSSDKGLTPYDQTNLCSSFSADRCQRGEARGKFRVSFEEYFHQPTQTVSVLGLIFYQTILPPGDSENREIWRNSIQPNPTRNPHVRRPLFGRLLGAGDPPFWVWHARVPLESISFFRFWTLVDTPRCRLLTNLGNLALG